MASVILQSFQFLIKILILWKQIINIKTKIKRPPCTTFSDKDERTITLGEKSFYKVVKCDNGAFLYKKFLNVGESGFVLSVLLLISKLILWLAFKGLAILNIG